MYWQAYCPYWRSPWRKLPPPPPQKNQELTIEEVTVTGSRIKRKDLITSSPVNIITTEAIELSGVDNIATIINELPSAGIPGSVDTATNFRTTTTGVNTIDLRNLRRPDEGGGRTLVLVNGRRHIGGSNGSSTVDLSMIPTALVERIEVVTGGASAVYGSEAIGGVVNFIFKDDYEGATIEGRYGSSQPGGATEKDISMLAGRNFANDKGNATFYLGYSDRGILRSAQRELSASDANNSSFGPKGNFFVPGTGLITQDDSHWSLGYSPWYWPRMVLTVIAVRFDSRALRAGATQRQP